MCNIAPLTCSALLCAQIEEWNFYIAWNHINCCLIKHLSLNRKNQNTSQTIQSDGNKLHVPKLSPDFSGLYICNASNQYGSALGSLYCHVHTGEYILFVYFYIYKVGLRFYQYDIGNNLKPSAHRAIFNSASWLLLVIVINVRLYRSMEDLKK